ncbi:hypothetical protein GUJ93_ZPchr0001g31189 [Zizania palustris]|uniref:Uncharacterized protein n=1 Tax=Zizania palustris TaxID=103762 RepID=A0A8J5VDB7_ZIZPA|nr:hypothetical protein GUJ93_ZPchr0001g31189 [Zizania palustris]
MDLPKRVLPQGSPRGSPMAVRRRDMETDENVGGWSPSPRRVVAERAASPQGKKVLGEMNSGGDGGRGAASPPPSQAKPATSPPSISACGTETYDPKTNYTMPRPDFLRYNPEKRREILLRLEREAEHESSSSTSGTAVSELVSSGSSGQVSDTESDGVGEEEIPSNQGGRARRLFLLLIAVACSCCYIYCMNSSTPPSSEMGHNLDGPNGSVHNSLGLRSPIEMMGSNRVFEEATSQIVHRNSENAVQINGHLGYPINFIAVATMGLSNVCPNVPFGEFACQIGDMSIDNVQQTQEDYQRSAQASEMIAVPFENAEQSHEVANLGGNVIGYSIGYTHTADMEEGKSEIAHLEEMEDLSDHSLQLAPLEKALEPEKEVLDDGQGLESDNLDQGAEPLEYENTAEAAKAIGAMMKFLWSSMKLPLKEMLACLCLAGLVFALLAYFQSSPKSAPVSQHTPAVSPAKLPILAPNQAAKLPVYHSSQSVHLFRSEQPVQLTVPKEEAPVNLEVPVQSPLPKLDSFVSLKVPVQLPLPKPKSFAILNIPVQLTLPKQKNQQEDADNARSSDGYTLAHSDTDSSRPPAVELLAEFSLVDDNSSRGRARKGSNEHGGNVPVAEPSVSLRKDVIKMQKESSLIKSPSARRTRKEEHAIKLEKTDATSTPLRRSNRLLKRVTSP